MKGKWASGIIMFSTLFGFCTSGNGHAKMDSKPEETLSRSRTGEPAAQEASIAYDLSKPALSWSLPPELKEISGNTWIDANHLLVIEDLHPILYLLRLEKDKAVIEKRIPFEVASDKKFDIEDVTASGNTAYALWSHGDIFKISNWQTHPEVKEMPTNLDKKNNTEGICIDPLSQNLLIACKNEAGLEEEKKSDRSIYLFDLSTEKLNTDPFLVIEKKDIKKLMGEKINFYPSAVAVHPQTHDVYVLSTKENKCMVQYTHDGKIKGFQNINKDLMPQPEGMCFSPEGTLFISTEGKHGEPARIYQFNK